MGTVILQQLSGRYLAIRDLLWHLPLSWDAPLALPLMWQSLVSAMPDLDSLESMVLVTLESMVLVTLQPLLLSVLLPLPLLMELNTTLLAPLFPMPPLRPGRWSHHRPPARPNCHQAGAPWTDQLCVRICHQDPRASHPPSSHRCPNCP